MLGVINALRRRSISGGGLSSGVGGLQPYCALLSALLPQAAAYLRTASAATTAHGGPGTTSSSVANTAQSVGLAGPVATA